MITYRATTQPWDRKGKVRYQPIVIAQTGIIYGLTKTGWESQHTRAPAPSLVIWFRGPIRALRVAEREARRRSRPSKPVWRRRAFIYALDALDEGE